MTVASRTISGNSAARFGAGIHVLDGSVTVASNTISGNSAHGGGIFADGDVTITSSTISGNSAGDDGGGTWADDDPVTIKNSIVAGDVGTGQFGGGGAVCSKRSPLSFAFRLAPSTRR